MASAPVLAASSVTEQAWRNAVSAVLDEKMGGPSNVTLPLHVLCGRSSKHKLPSSFWPTLNLTKPREEELERRARLASVSSSDLGVLEATARRTVEAASFSDLSVAALKSYVLADQDDFDFDRAAVMFQALEESLRDLSTLAVANAVNLNC